MVDESVSFAYSKSYEINGNKMVYVIAERAPYNYIRTKQTLSILRANYVPGFSIEDLNAILLYSFATT
jgi:hypothetical protein